MLFVDTEAPCAALTKGEAKTGAAILLVYAMWTVPARYGMAIWIERLPPELDAADLPPGGQKLPFDAEAGEEPISLAEMDGSRELSRIPKR